METYDDRPISVYDNLNMPTTTTATGMHIATTKASKAPTQTQLPTSVNGAAQSAVFADLSFQFNDNNEKQYRQHQLQQQLQQQQKSLPNGNQCYNQYGEQVLSNYRTAPATNTGKTASQTPIPTPAPTSSPSTTTSSSTPLIQQQRSTMGVTPTALTAATAAATVQRPLSQHSQSELNEASQNIAAVKAALNDAKSKFFGLNGYAQEAPNTTNHESPVYTFLPTDIDTEHSRVQITQTKPATTTTNTTPPPKPPQPKYQNIPENSAIFRSQQPPELPPKPTERLLGTPANNYTEVDTSLPATAMQTSSFVEMPLRSPSPSPSPTKHTSVSPTRTLPYSTMYQQIPLNDIDSIQPSQAVYMSTTVPQNIKGSKIAGRHTPTRNSLRHSRMLVVNNKSYQGTQHPNPMNFKQPNLARWLLILQLLIGLLISFLAVWIFVLAPNTSIQDNPFWCGLTLMVAGIFGLVLVRYQRIKRHKVRENCFVFMRANSYVLSLLAVLLCSVALIFAGIHYCRLTAHDTKCVSTNILLVNGSCACTFHAPTATTAENTTDTLSAENSSAEGDEPEDRSYQVVYRDLSCTEVRGEWIVMLECSIALNALGFIISIFYIILLLYYRYNSKRFYTSAYVSSF